MLRAMSEISEAVKLSDILYGGFDSYQIEFAPPLSRPMGVWLCRGSTALHVKCIMLDVAPRWEVGVLAFSIDTPPAGLKVAPPEWLNIEQVYRLEIQEPRPDEPFRAPGSVVVESGILLVNKLGHELAVVAGAWPFSTEISASFIPTDFSPQYGLNEYSRVLIEP